MANAVGILANPRAGGDVRRLAARASSSTLESKRNQVVRAAVGARAAGAERVVIVRDPQRVATGALETLALDLEVEVLDIGARHDASDSHRAAEALQRSFVDATEQHRRGFLLALADLLCRAGDDMQGNVPWRPADVIAAALEAAAAAGSSRR